MRCTARCGCARPATAPVPRPRCARSGAPRSSRPSGSCSATRSPRSAATSRSPTTTWPRWTRYATGPRRSRRRCRDRPGHQRRLRGDAAQAESRRADLAQRPSRRHPLPVERVARGTAVRHRGPARRSEEEPAGAGAPPAARPLPPSRPPPSDPLYLSSVSLAELLFGIGALPVGARKNRLAQALDRLLALFPGRVLPFDQDAARRYADMAVPARTVGRPLPTVDGYLAATAAARGFAVSTRNVKDFGDTGVELIDPWQGH